MSHFRFAPMLILGLGCLMAPFWGESGIIHTESSIFTQQGGGSGEVRVDLEIEDLGATRIWRYRLTNLSFEATDRLGVVGGVNLVHLFFDSDSFFELGTADESSAPVGWGSAKSADFPVVLFVSHGPALEIGDAGLFSFSEVERIDWFRNPYFGPVALGPHEIVLRADRLYFGRADTEHSVEMFDAILTGSISVPGARPVIPEPSTLTLSAFGLAELFVALRARRRDGAPLGRA